MDKQTLSPLVKRLADYYGFTISWCDILNYWVVRDEEMNCGFFWTSDKSEDVFLDDLAFYFRESG